MEPLWHEEESVFDVALGMSTCTRVYTEEVNGEYSRGENERIEQHYIDSDKKHCTE